MAAGPDRTRKRARAGEQVLLVHGLWNAKSWLAPLAWRLRRAGFVVRGFGYSSVRDGPEAAIDALAALLRRSGPVHLVGHSLGGMIGLEVLRRVPELPVQRMVCLGSPLCGSATARALAGHARLGWTLGRSAGLLDAGCGHWDGRVPVGMVAGTVERGLGRLVVPVESPSDGTVAVAETRLPGLAGHVLVPASHSGLLFSAEAARQAAAFLHHGAFLDPAGGPGRPRPL